LTSRGAQAASLHHYGTKSSSGPKLALKPGKNAILPGFKARLPLFTVPKQQTFPYFSTLSCAK